MKAIIIFISLVLTTLFCANSQEVIFKNIDFSKEGYYLYLMDGEKKDRGLLINPNSHIDTIHNFYTSNVAVLKSMQREWKLKEADVYYLCGYDYKIFLVKGDSILLSMLLNLDCKQMIFNGQEYDFEPKLLMKHWASFKPIIARQRKFETKAEGQEYWDSITVDETYIFKDKLKPGWLDYEGQFSLYIDNYKKPVEVTKARLEKEIKALYPNEPFEIGNECCPFIIYCNESLYQKFRLYETHDTWYKYTDFRIDTKQIPERKSSR